MIGEKGNTLIVIEDGRITEYELDDKLVWNIGRASKGNIPDIRLYSTTVSRQHGRIKNTDGIWFYVDRNSKNGTIYNGNLVTTGIKGRVKPIMLKDGDVMILGGGKTNDIKNNTIWMRFSGRHYRDEWHIEETMNMTKLIFKYGDELSIMNSPSIGDVFEKENGMAIYMGDITYVIGDISLIS